jgi:hypothetical protein
MHVMPKKIDPKVKERCVRMVLDHLSEYPTLTAAAEVVAKREGVGGSSTFRGAGRVMLRLVVLG